MTKRRLTSPIIRIEWMYSFPSDAIAVTAAVSAIGGITGHALAAPCSTTPTRRVSDTGDDVLGNDEALRSREEHHDHRAVGESVTVVAQLKRQVCLERNRDHSQDESAQGRTPQAPDAAEHGGDECHEHGGRAH